jgi:beta-xylosidase
VVLLSNGDGVLPLGDRGRIAVVGPFADDPAGMMGCYAFPRHVGVEHPDVPMGVSVATVREALRAEFPGAELVDDPAGADLCIAVLGDRSGLFGRGTSGEGCDAPDLELPDGQGEMLDALLEAGTPVVLVLLTGRPYALGRWADRLAAVVQAFFPGQEGGRAVAGVLSGRVNPSGKLPVQIAQDPGINPATYLHPALGGYSHAISSLDPTALFPFGHGLSYTTFGYSDLRLSAARILTDGCVTAAVTVTNTGDRAGAEVIQLYYRDPVASVTRPVRQLLGFARVSPEPGQAATVSFDIHADRFAFVGASLDRMVEPGTIELYAGSSSTDIRSAATLELQGQARSIRQQRRLGTSVRVQPHCSAQGDGVRERADAADDSERRGGQQE